MFGGFSHINTCLNSIEKLVNNEKWELINLKNTPSLAKASLISKNNEKILVFGGSDGKNVSKNIYAFDFNNNSTK